MQNKFACDVSDFGKYGILRFLNGLTAGDGLPNYRLGVVWYLQPDERHNGAGRHTSYLFPAGRDDRAEYWNCDHNLWHGLRSIMLGENGWERCVCCVRSAGILPRGTEFFDWQLVYVQHLPQEVKAQMRDHWLRRARLAMQDTELVYLDPDVNLADDGDMYSLHGTKYAYMDDLRAFWDCGKSLVFYHQRQGLTQAQIYDVALRVEGALGVCPIPLRLRRGGTPAFFVVPKPEHRAVIVNRIGRFMAGPWGGLFTRFNCEGGGCVYEAGVPI